MNSIISFISWFSQPLRDMVSEVKEKRCGPELTDEKIVSIAKQAFENHNSESAFLRLLGKWVIKWLTSISAVPPLPPAALPPPGSRSPLGLRKKHIPCGVSVREALKCLAERDKIKAAATVAD